MKRIFSAIIVLAFLACQNPFSRPEATSDLSLVIELPYTDPEVAAPAESRLLSLETYALEIILDVPGLPTQV
jgi:hypothetical protein